MTRATWVAAALLLLAASETSAATIDIGYTSARLSGALRLTYEPNTSAGDPGGSYKVTDVSGTFTSVVLGLTNATVTGVVPLNRVSPETGNLLAPASFSLLPIASGVPAPGGATSLGFHYDNLLYPAGDSPQSATDYTQHGGIFDIYGLAFTVAGGFSVNLWSNGEDATTPLTYGMGLTDGRTVRDYDFGGVTVAQIPEPSSWLMIIVGFGLIGIAVRRRGRTIAFG